MADKFTHKISFFNIPSIDNLQDIPLTMKMINTVNVFPHPSSYNDLPLQLNNQPQQSNSLAEQLKNHPTSSSVKKKKVGCTCKKTLCLKMYCQCFSSGKHCGPDCACQGCKNTNQHEQQIFHAKNQTKQGGLRNCSLSQKRCNCVKSGCLKRYCECYNSKVGCTEACKCVGCQNKKEDRSQINNYKQQNQIKDNIFPLAQFVSTIQNEQMKKEIGGIFPSMNVVSSFDDFQRFVD